MSAQASVASAARLPRHVPVTVVLVLVGGAVLGGVPSWEILYFLWCFVGIPALLLNAGFELLMLFRALDHGARPAVVRRRWRLAICVGALPVLMLLGGTSDIVEVARLGSQLRAQARSHGREGDSHIAIVQTGDSGLARWGYLYDDSGEIAKPCGTQSEAWLDAAVAGQLGDYCSRNISHVIGPFFRWGER